MDLRDRFPCNDTVISKGCEDGVILCTSEVSTIGLGTGEIKYNWRLYIDRLHATSNQTGIFRSNF